MSGIVVRHARVPGAARVRHALEHWLAALEPRDWGLPPEAIVALRHARVPAAAVGREAPAQALGALLRGAARPARGDLVGAACPAVWFADEAELLACLAGDALDGALAQRWWWSLLEPGRVRAGGAAAWARWVAAPRAVPAALQRLGPARARAWLGSGDGAARRALLEALAHAWPVPPGLPERVARAEAGPIVGAAAKPEPRLVARAGTRAAPAVAPRREPGERDADGLPPDVVVDAATWLQALCSVLVEAPQQALDLAVIASRAVAIIGAGHALHAASDGTPARHLAPPQTARRTAEARHTSPLQERGPGLAADLDHGSDAIAPIPETAADADRRQDGDARAPQAPPVAPPRRPRAATLQPRLAPPTAPAAAIDTRFGGLFFLLNVATALGLYGDFTQPQHRGLPCSPWHWLQRAGRTSLGRRFRADPLDAWLQAQSGAAPPLPRPAAWAADAAQRAAFAADTRACHLLADATGQRLLHPAGFVLAWQAGPAVLDVPPGTLVHRPRRRAAPPDLWTLIWPLVRARLGAALGLPPRAALALTLQLPARLQAGAGRVELQFALPGLPLALRYAGLDRDPGWLPAAGSDIRFRFD